MPDATVLFKFRPRRWGRYMKCGTSFEDAVRKPWVCRPSGKIALTPSLVVGVLVGIMGLARPLAARVCKSWPTIRVSCARGCVYWASTGPRHIGTRIGLAGGCRVRSSFGLIAWRNPVLLNRIPRRVKRRAMRTLRHCSLACAASGKVLLATSGGAPQASVDGIGRSTSCANALYVASRAGFLKLGIVGSVGLLLTLAPSQFRVRWMAW